MADEKVYSKTTSGGNNCRQIVLWREPRFIYIVGAIMIQTLLSSQWMIKTSKAIKIFTEALNIDSQKYNL